MPQELTSEFLDIPVSLKSLRTLTQEAMVAISRERQPVVFACANPHSLLAARSDDVFKSALLNAEQVVADGVGITLMGRIAGVKLGSRITGSDYFSSIMMALMEKKGGGRVFFFGSSQKVLDLIAQRMHSEFPSIILCGTLSPPFRAWSEQENNTMIAEINAARPDVLWVGMTAPKQEKWVFKNRYRLDVPVIGSVGAVFDFFAGTYPRAPAWMCRLGLEWVYRLISEPRRMWRRNFVSTPVFVYRVLVRYVFGFERG